MYLSKYQSAMQCCLARAAELLGGPARPVGLDWELDRLLRKQLRWEARSGLGSEPAVVFIDRSRRGHALHVGMDRYRFETSEGRIPVVRVEMPCSLDNELAEFWAVRAADYRQFYRRLRRAFRAQDQHPPPLMAPAQQERLWDNTIGLLRRRQEDLLRYGVVPKRGVLLAGDPGNGKTMACRWLESECRRWGLEWKSVSAQAYEAARAEHQLPELFKLDSPGIVLFDDFDCAVRKRDDNGEGVRHSTFLTELDGVDQKTGIVYLFTSNVPLEEMDRAMCRPGRLDAIVHFPPPDLEMRRRLIAERWHEEIRGGIDDERVAAETDGLSFAELDEIRKLLVMRHLETGRWDWPHVHSVWQERRLAARSRRPMGFATGSNGNGRGTRAGTSERAAP